MTRPNRSSSRQTPSGTCSAANICRPGKSLSSRWARHPHSPWSMFEAVFWAYQSSTAAACHMPATSFQSRAARARRCVVQEPLLRAVWEEHSYVSVTYFRHPIDTNPQTATTLVTSRGSGNTGQAWQIAALGLSRAMRMQARRFGSESRDTDI